MPQVRFSEHENDALATSSAEMTLSGQCPVCRNPLALPEAMLPPALATESAVEGGTEGNAEAGALPEPRKVTDPSKKEQCQCDCGATLDVCDLGELTEIEFRCGECDSIYVVDRLGAGESLDCRCGAALTVPNVRLLQPLAAPERASAPDHSPTPESFPPSGTSEAQERVGEQETNEAPPTESTSKPENHNGDPQDGDPRDGGPREAETTNAIAAIVPEQPPAAPFVEKQIPEAQPERDAQAIPTTSISESIVATTVSLAVDSTLDCEVIDGTDGDDCDQLGKQIVVETQRNQPEPAQSIVSFLIESEQHRAERSELPKPIIPVPPRSELVEHANKPETTVEPEETTHNDSTSNDSTIHHLHCPGCRFAFSVPDGDLGQTAECECGFVFILEKDTASKDLAFQSDLVSFIPPAIDRTGSLDGVSSGTFDSEAPNPFHVISNEAHSAPKSSPRQPLSERDQTMPTQRAEDGSTISARGITWRVVLSLGAIVLIASSSSWLPRSWRHNPTTGAMMPKLLNDEPARPIPMTARNTETTLDAVTKVTVASHVEVAKSPPLAMISLRKLAGQLTNQEPLGETELYKFADAVTEYGDQHTTHSVADLFWLGETWEKLGDQTRNAALSYKCFWQSAAAYALAQTVQGISKPDLRVAQQRQSALSARSQEASRLAKLKKR